ncbi:MAG: hypothetical protein IT379_18580 [Deltaproteobacteria bacterium]|nr:hypothetical protein [Deltaproteobacteria bacterium]
MSEAVLLGLDIGSTTVKAVVLSPWGRVMVSHVARHRGALRLAVRRAVLALDLGEALVQVYLTGSGARAVGLAASSPIVHETSATAATTRMRHADVRSVIEIGGQDAKLIWLEPKTNDDPGRVDASMNDRCAAGTGATLDRCLLRLGDETRRLLATPYDPARVRPISSKCGVFAETDLVNLLRAGLSPEDAIVSLADALVLQTLAVLARGRRIEPKTLLLGGPGVHFAALAGAWRHHLGRRDGLASASANDTSLVEVPDEAMLYGAIGACLVGARRENVPARSVRALLAAITRVPAGISLRLDPAFVASAPASGHGEAHAIDVERPAWRPSIAAGGPVLGIDAGSTRFKGVLLDGDGHVVASAERASGNPADDVLAIRDALARELPQGTDIVATGVTGYGAGAAAALLGRATVVVETVAHARAARAAVPEADVVCDVGGQDIKVMMLDEEGAVRDFRLSGQCHAGIGLVMESTARELGVTLPSYGATAAQAQRAPLFGDGCVVFLDADRVTFQRQGFAREEILAGLARALPRIVWQQVLGGVAPSSLGKTFVLSGGTQHNVAAVEAQAAYLRERVAGVRVCVHPHPSLAGAIGAALAAVDARSGDLGSLDPRRERPTISVAHVASTSAPTCGLCPSACPRSVVRAERTDGTEALHVLGALCEAGETMSPTPTVRARVSRRRTETPDLLLDEAHRLFAPTRTQPIRRAESRATRIGAPRVLGMYRAAPFFRGYTEALDFGPRQLVFSPETGDNLWRHGAGLGASDPCYPVKVVLAHVAHLVSRGLRTLLVPRLTHAVSVCGRASSCPVVVASSLLVRDAIERGELGTHAIELLDGPVTLCEPAALGEQMHALLGERLGASRVESDRAVERGLVAMHLLDETMRARGRAVLDAVARDRTRAAVVVLARPYHADPGINHRVTAEIAALGYPVLSIRSLPPDDRLSPADVHALAPEVTNSGALERLWAARYAARHGQLAVLDLSSFKCAQDTATAAPIRALLDDARVVTCTLHDLDETRPATSLRTRVRTFAHALSARGFEPWNVSS